MFIFFTTFSSGNNDLIKSKSFVILLSKASIGGTDSDFVESDGLVSY